MCMVSGIDRYHYNKRSGPRLDILPVSREYWSLSLTCLIIIIIYICQSKGILITKSKPQDMLYRRLRLSEFITQLKLKILILWSRAYYWIGRKYKDLVVQNIRALIWRFKGKRSNALNQGNLFIKANRKRLIIHFLPFSNIKGSDLLVIV